MVAITPNKSLEPFEREHIEEVGRYISFEVKQIQAENFRSEDGIIEIPKEGPQSIFEEQWEDEDEMDFILIIVLVFLAGGGCFCFLVLIFFFKRCKRTVKTDVETQENPVQATLYEDPGDGVPGKAQTL